MTTRISVKICGLTSREDALLAVRTGADAVGVVFAKSKRRVDIEKALAIADVARMAGAELGRSVDIYGVFVNESSSVIRETAAIVGLDVIQLHGDEPPEVASELAGFRLVKAIAAGGPDAYDKAQPYGPAAGFEAVLLDGISPTARGGTGRLACWDVASDIASEMRVILAGGLMPGNVIDAIRAVRPAMVDVSSGVESSPGAKSPDLVERFIRQARSWQE